MSQRCRADTYEPTKTTWSGVIGVIAGDPKNTCKKIRHGRNTNFGNVGGGGVVFADAGMLEEFAVAAEVES
jgi:hypothetical protein